MINLIFKLGFSALLFFLIAACGSSPKRLPLAIEQAKKTDQVAHRALGDGDLMLAREMFKQVMLLQRSMDNIPAATMAAINLSSVNHKLGNTDESLLLLDQILTDHTSLLPLDLKATAAFRKGIILADNGRDEEANSALQLAKDACINPCVLTAGINNLRARLMMKKGNFAAALAIVQGVMSTATEKEEQANAKRIAGAANAALGQHKAAEADYNSALILDKELALSARIADDLLGISKALSDQGRVAEADEYAHRAEEVIAATRMLNSNIKTP